MEKLQKAIAKARATREGDAAKDLPAAGSAAPPPPQTQAATGPHSAMGAPMPDVWSQIDRFTPDAARLARHRVVSYQGGSEAREFDTLRTRIVQQMRANNWTRLAITSPGPSSGKSTLALNLAFGLARQPDQRSIVMEIDMRKPSLSHTLGLSKPQHFDAVLRGTAPFEEHAVRAGDHMAFATNSRKVGDAAELLQSAATGAALDQIQARYDPTVMLFDMPPMLVSDDTMAFLGYVDCVLLLAATEQTTIKQIDACEREIATQSNVMGVVLNKCRYVDEPENYSYY